jgi:hypothetical protein
MITVRLLYTTAQGARPLWYHSGAGDPRRPQKIFVVMIRRFAVAFTMFVAATAFGGQLLAQPVPGSTKAPKCSVPNAPSRVVRFGRAFTPSLVAQKGIGGTAGVLVKLNSESYIIGAQAISVRNGELDKAAVEAAKTSTFLTRIVNCVPVASEYFMRVKFSGSPRVPATLVEAP